MATFILKAMLPLLLLSFVSPKTVHGEYEQWCVADEQTSDSEVQAALDWACGRGGADCNKIQVNQPCYFPNTLQNHASFAFNSYFQKFKHKGGSCYFRGYGSCHYDFIP
ncbi:glucan endo-1,3-beta-glucosidase 12 [Senna tora]|uniref:Glucan endo-1,3-beta-glucosidase 12 n=1 Tax=Senna tora TaxID=362788 RepID=A0A834TSP6_9FABA|nr:glucan endo-1,3-beta-glucosidase 12 [Senna tora]